jgi:hypothetical protein
VADHAALAAGSRQDLSLSYQFVITECSGCPIYGKIAVLGRTGPLSGLQVPKTAIMATPGQRPSAVVLIMTGDRASRTILAL